MQKIHYSHGVIVHAGSCEAEELWYSKVQADSDGVLHSVQTNSCDGVAGAIGDYSTSR